MTILTEEGAGAVTKAGGCETRATAAGGNGTCQPLQQHFQDALHERGIEAAAGRDPCQHEASTGLCGACCTPALHMALTNIQCAEGA